MADWESVRLARRRPGDNQRRRDDEQYLRIPDDPFRERGCGFCGPMKNE